MMITMTLLPSRRRVAAAHTFEGAVPIVQQIAQANKFDSTAGGICRARHDFIGENQAADNHGLRRCCPKFGKSFDRRREAAEIFAANSGIVVEETQPFEQTDAAK